MQSDSFRLWRWSARVPNDHVFMSEVFSVFRFHLVQLHSLFGSKERRNLDVTLTKARHHALHGFAMNGFHVRPGFLNQRFDFRGLFRRQMKPRFQVFEHVARHLIRSRWPHESATDHRSNERSSGGAGKEDKRGVENDFAGHSPIHNQNRR